MTAHRHSEFLAFLKLIARRYPRRELQVVLDNYGTHKHPAVGDWLDTHPRVRLHFTPTSASWMNQVETFFGLLTRQAIRRSTHRSVPDLWLPSTATSTPGPPTVSRSRGSKTPTTA